MTSEVNHYNNMVNNTTRSEVNHELWTSSDTHLTHATHIKTHHKKLINIDMNLNIF
jgi:hypothetical protein